MLALTLFAATVAAQQTGPAANSSRRWDPAAAATYLDARMDLWFANGNKLRTGDTQTACVSCHAGLACALSRPVLRRVMHVDTPSTQEAKLIDDRTRRVETYSTHQVLYDFNERRQIRKGIQWLETNQREVPVPDVPGRAWHAHSLNYDREHGGEKGEPWRRLFMSDTATAFAILALADGE